jgi:acetylglutamate kinase
MIRYHSQGRQTPDHPLAPNERAEVLIEALPYLRQFGGKTLVVKFGGAAMTSPELRDAVMQDIALMRYVGLKPVIVHGSGPETDSLLRRLGGTPASDGQTIMDEATIGLVEMAISGGTNKSLVALLNRHGTQAVGLSGKDAHLLMARKLESDGRDLGFTGEIVGINAAFIQMLSDQGYVPVICSVAEGEDGQTYKVDADHAAGAVASALEAEKLIVLNDHAGLYSDAEDPGTLVSELDVQDALGLIASGKPGPDMKPKLEACVAAVQSGVARAHLIDGRQPHSLLIEILTDAGVGTMVTPQASWKPKPAPLEVLP